jgi:hypothetical protein
MAITALYTVNIIMGSFVSNRITATIEAITIKNKGK